MPPLSYSKWDNLDYDSSDNEEQEAVAAAKTATTSDVLRAAVTQPSRKKQISVDIVSDPN